MGEHISLDIHHLTFSPESASSQISPPTYLSQNDIMIIPGNSDSFQHELIPSGATGSTALSFSALQLSGPMRDSQSEDNGLLECRICQEEDGIVNLEAPCACSGSVKYAHRKCVQLWCNEKGDTTCEICNEPYRSGYTVSSRLIHSNSIPMQISEDWSTPEAHSIELGDPRILAIAAAQRHLLGARYDEYATVHSSGATCCRSVVLILMALLLFRHALAMAAASADEDVSMLLMLFLLRGAGFLLPCYIMARAMNMMQRSRQRQNAAMVASEVALLLQAGQAQGMRL